MGGTTGESGGGGEAGGGAGGEAGLGGAGGDGTGGLGGRGGRGGGANPGGAGGEAGTAGEGGAGGAGETTPNLFFSEYAETTGTDPDAVEIINKSGADMSLSGCSVLVYANAAAAPTATINLTGSVDDDDVFVLCTAAIGTRCDQTSASLALDGNDAVALRCGTTLLDIIGRTIGASPGAQWGNATVGTQNQTLRRNCEVTIGDRIGTNPFTPSAEWTSFAVDTITGLGSPTCG